MFKESWDGSSCLLDDVLEREAGSERLVCENKDAVAFCPYASMFPFEVWVVPRRHVRNIAGLSESERISLAGLTRSVLKALHDLLGDPPYNYVFHQSTYEEYHMYLRILPRLSIFAGFELNTGIMINTVPPEMAASRIRKTMEEAV
ncbi:MAG: hypothetical protein KIH01_07815 [Candidatus Freyarchaeota archaeon]|nr:hypothetical protein [Candidatus Jordarchaeia archaeon]